MLANVVSWSDFADIYRIGRSNFVKNGTAPDLHDPAENRLGRSPRDVCSPDLRLSSGGVPGQPT